jgi:hypothetical protein
MTTSGDGSVSIKQEAKETPEQRFRRVATRRTRQTLRCLRLLANTSNQAYKYTQAEADAIFTTLRKALAETEAKFSEVHEETFSL